MMESLPLLRSIILEFFHVFYYIICDDMKFQTWSVSPWNEEPAITSDTHLVQWV